VAALSVRTARNRRTRTRMSGGVGARRGNPPGDPIRPHHCASREAWRQSNQVLPAKFFSRVSPTMKPG
jgi:hypothetical protein